MRFFPPVSFHIYPLESFNQNIKAAFEFYKSERPEEFSCENSHADATTMTLHLHRLNGEIGCHEAPSSSCGHWQRHLRRVSSSSLSSLTSLLFSIEV